MNELFGLNSRHHSRNTHLTECVGAITNSILGMGVTVAEAYAILEAAKRQIEEVKVSEFMVSVLQETPGRSS